MSETITVDAEAAAFARKTLTEWFDKSARSFPWRYDSNPYHVLVAEMMLRRTRAKQVVAVYNQFIIDYPDMASLASAPPQRVMKSLQPLGLAWRAANFEKLAQAIMTEHGGIVPDNREVLLQLPGVGPYVADAVLCFAFGKPATLVDTNTVRVAARYFGFEYDQEARRRREVIRAVSNLIDSNVPARSNYALLDFAALVCRVRNPEHDNCPLAVHCTHYIRITHQKAILGKDITGEADNISDNQIYK